MEFVFTLCSLVTNVALAAISLILGFCLIARIASKQRRNKLFSAFMLAILTGLSVMGWIVEMKYFIKSMECVGMLKNQEVRLFGSHTVTIRGEIKENAKKNIEGAIRVMPKEMVENIGWIIVQENDHFEGELAHTIYILRSICVNPNVEKRTIWHEAIHVRRQILGSAFKKEWEEIAGEVYDNLCFKDEKGIWCWKDGGYLAKHGCASPYGATNADEDIATFGAAIYGLLYSFDMTLSRPSPADQRYAKKLALLKKGGFITEKDYKLAKMLLGS